MGVCMLIDRYHRAKYMLLQLGMQQYLGWHYRKMSIEERQKACAAVAENEFLP